MADRTNFRWGNGINTATGYDPNAQNGNTNSWTDADWSAYEQHQGITSPPPTQGTPQSSTPAPITTQQQVGNTTAPVGGSIAQGAPTTVAQSFQQALVNRLNPSPVSASSPEVSGAIQANNLAQQRGMERNRNLLAERAAANGQDLSGGFETNLLGLAQNRAAQEGQFAGNAVQQAQQNQDLNTRSAMAQAAGLLGGNAGLSQAQSLAELQAAIQREGIAQQGALGQGDLALRQRLGESGLNNQLLGLLMQNDQFGRSLGQNASQFGASLDQSGLMGLLGLL